MDSANIYAEVFEFLSYMDKQTVMKIPLEVLELFKEKRNKNYISKINKNDLFNIDNVSIETRSMLAWINLNYWATEKEKIALMEIYRKNEIEFEEEKKKEFYQTHEDVFSAELKIVDNYENNIETSFMTIDGDKQMCVKKENLLDKIKNFIKHLFYKN